MDAEHASHITLLVCDTWPSRYVLFPQDLTLHNADEYCELVEDFCLRSGIRRQMEAFKCELYCSVSIPSQYTSLEWHDYIGLLFFVVVQLVLTVSF